MPTKPGFVWNGTEWIPLWSEATVHPFKYQASAPTSPATGDIWIDSDYDIPSVDISQFLRWSKTVTGGQTSLSGADDNALVLQYTPNYEQVYINGVLQVRGQDYVATTGNSITGLTALASGDVVEVFSTVARTVADVYTQAQVNSLVSTTGLVLINTTDFSGSSAVNFNNVFSSNYKNYHIINSITGNGSAGLFFRFRSLGVDDSSNNYHYQMISAQTSTLSTSRTQSTSLPIGGAYSITNQFSELKIINPFLPVRTDGSTFAQQDGGSSIFINGISAFNIATGTSYDGFTIFPNTGNITGTIKVYGYK